MSDASSGEVWRLHNHTGTVMTCAVTAEPQGHYLFVIRTDGVEVRSEDYRFPDAALEEAESVRRRLLSEGWSGVFPRMP